MTDLERLIEKYKKEIAYLEAQIEEVSHKRDILVEATRLLQEDLLTPHKTLYERLSDAGREKE